MPRARDRVTLTPFFATAGVPEVDPDNARTAGPLVYGVEVSFSVGTVEALTGDITLDITAPGGADALTGDALTALNAVFAVPVGGGIWVGLDPGDTGNQLVIACEVLSNTPQTGFATTSHRYSVRSVVVAGQAGRTGPVIPPGTPGTRGARAAYVRVDRPPPAVMGLPFTARKVWAYVSGDDVSSAALGALGLGVGVSPADVDGVVTMEVRSFAALANFDWSNYGLNATVRGRMYSVTGGQVSDDRRHIVLRAIHRIVRWGSTG